LSEQAALANEIQNLLRSGQKALAAGQWAEGVRLFGAVLQRQSDIATAWHNLAVCLSGLGRWQAAMDACKKALQIAPNLWQSYLIWGKSSKSLGDCMQAEACFKNVLQSDPNNAPARVALADLYMNTFGQPLVSVELVKPLLDSPDYAEDAELTTIMAGLYDRDTDANTHNQRVIAFSKKSLHLDIAALDFLDPGHRVEQSMLPLPSAPHWMPASARKRPRVGLISPLFCASPVYFLTIAGWMHVAKGCEVVIFNRGHKMDWATQIFKQLASEWHDVQDIDAKQLAFTLYNSQLDVLYDLGGWMDPVGLKALSIKPAPQMFKWVGGQSVTTGLHSFDGWIGDIWQSPASMQSLYTEPLIAIEGGYATYVPPPYMPKAPKVKRDVPVIFSNPAKLSRSFLSYLQTIPGKKCFLHQQFKYPQARVQVLKYLPSNEVEFITPTSHKEALEVLGQHHLMIDTFPYSGGLTAQEALALGVKVQARAGTLFCERHSAKAMMQV
jgi:predicted O-linked N-acetylglucosamine transferase (SPINDLY family)